MFVCSSHSVIVWLQMNGFCNRESMIMLEQIWKSKQKKVKMVSDVCLMINSFSHISYKYNSVSLFDDITREVSGSTVSQRVFLKPERPFWTTLTEHNYDKQTCGGTALHLHKGEQTPSCVINLRSGSRRLFIRVWSSENETQTELH